MKIKPTMSSAQTYLSSNVVERLTRPVAAQQHSNSSNSLHDESATQYFDPQSATNERPIIDMASFMGSLGGGAPKGDNFSTPGKPTNGKGGAATEGKAKRDAKFEMFLARQQANLKKRADSQKLVSKRRSYCGLECSLTSIVFVAIPDGESHDANIPASVDRQSQGHPQQGSRLNRRRCCACRRHGGRQREQERRD
jgi:hypothetical protein